MRVTEATENYLETIYMIYNRKAEVHAIDICDELGYSRPTVSVFLKQLKENGFVTVDSNNHITLTEKGLAVAERIYERHTLLAQMLMAIGVDKETAYGDACKIEHDISDKTFECIKKHFNENKEKNHA